MKGAWFGGLKTKLIHGGKDLGRGIILSILKDAKIDRKTYEDES